MILVVDFGSQTAHMIGRRLRQLGVAVEYVDPETVLDAAHNHQPTGIILSGGPASVYADDAHTIDAAVFELDVPVLGICYGWQLMAQLLGGVVEPHQKEYGPRQLLLEHANAFGTLPQSLWVYMSHGDTVLELPDGFTSIGQTESVEHAMCTNGERKLTGVQFHPEVDHTEYGLEMLRHFAIDQCGEELNPFELDPDEIIEQIRETVGDAQVLCAVSGGVDSTVASFLIGKAIGKQLIPVHVDSGLMRPGTTEFVERLFSDLVEADLVVIEAREQFMDVLRGLDDPEEKRKAIGKLYVDLFAAEAKKHPDAKFLGQGTIYSDVIESKGSKKASKIKSHHNVGGLPDDLSFELLEPVRHLYKDEVRELGRKAGVPEEIVSQEPMPGPGYAIRIRGEVTQKRLEQIRIADTIVVEELKKAGIYERLFHGFAIMTGAYSTAVKGDARAFSEIVALRAVESRDIMTASWADIPYDVLQSISSRIVNEVPDVSRVVYDITTKPPATTEWE